MLTLQIKYLYHKNLYSQASERKCIAAVAQMVRPFIVKPKVGVQMRMIAVAHAQSTLYILSRFVSWPSTYKERIPDSKVHGANMGPTWVLSAPVGPHVGPMNLAIRDAFHRVRGPSLNTRRTKLTFLAIWVVSCCHRIFVLYLTNWS